MFKAKAAFLSVSAAAILATVAGCGNNASPNNAANNSSNATNNATNNTSNATTTSSGGTVTLNETGSSLLYPLFNGQWISAYQATHKNVRLTAASTGSGTGISQAVAGTVQIGASDAYMPTAQIQQTPGIVNIPLAISAQQIMYNLPGMKKGSHLNLTGDVLAQIFMGKITSWNDPQIAKLNPGVSLPNQPIIPVHRSDSSGDTFLFTQFLTDTSKTWASQVNYSTAPSWPAVTSAIGSQGNEGVVTTLAQTKYSIGYVGISWLTNAVKQGLGYAALQNKAGAFVLPTSANIESAVNAQVKKVPADERISLIYSPGANSYPIINFEYAIVNTKKQTGSTAAELKKFLNWAISPTGGNSSKYLAPVNFLPLPASIEPKSAAQVNKIGG